MTGGGWAKPYYKKWIGASVSDEVGSLLLAFCVAFDHFTSSYGDRELRRCELLRVSLTFGVRGCANFHVFLLINQYFARGNL